MLCTYTYIYIYICIYVWVYIYTYSETSSNRPTMEPTLNGPFREVVGVGRLVMVFIVSATIWDPNKEWWICGGG